MNQPKQTAFSQQRLDAWRPIFTPVLVFIILLLIGAALLAGGIVMHAQFSRLLYVEQRYDDLCDGKSTCNVTLTVPKDFTGPIFLHYKLTHFYQTHSRYVMSRSDSQLRGEYVEYKDLTECDPFRSYDDSDNISELILPCGALAVSVFNDTFNVYNSNSDNLRFSEVGISWRSDREKLFKNISKTYEENGAQTWFNDELFPREQRSEHFITWMRASSLPTFLKLYSKCTACSLTAGNYTVVVKNNYPASFFHGEKRIILSTTTPIGGKNYYFSVSYIVVGSFLLLSAFVIIFSHSFCPRTMGDTNYLSNGHYN